MTNKPVDLHTAGGIAAALAGTEFDTVRYADRHQQLAAHLGFDADDIIHALDHIPLCLRDSLHRDARKRLAILISDGTTRASQVMQDRLPVLVAQLLAPGCRDVMSCFVNPLVDLVMSAMVDVPLALNDSTMVSRVFSQSIGVAKRKRMNAELQALRNRIETTKPMLTATEVGDRIALCILGTDAMRGTLGCSLHAILGGQKGFSTDQVSAAYPPRTGVPYVDREALEAVSIEGQHYPAGTTFRARLDSFDDHSDPELRQRFFGFGAHTCLGRKFSLSLWQAVTDALQENPVPIRLVQYHLRRDDVFNIPEKFDIEVGHARQSANNHTGA